MKRVVVTVLLVTAALFVLLSARGHRYVIQSRDASLMLEKIMIAEYGGIRSVRFNLVSSGDVDDNRRYKVRRNLKNLGTDQFFEFYEDDELSFSLEIYDYGNVVNRISPDGVLTEIAPYETGLYPAGFPYTYEDLYSLNFTNDYSAAFLFKENIESVECNVISLRPLSPLSSYARIVIWAGVEDSLIHRADYYDRSYSTRVKSMSALGFGESDGVKYRSGEAWTDFVDGRLAQIRVTQFQLEKTEDEKEDTREDDHGDKAEKTEDDNRPEPEPVEIKESYSESAE